MLERARRGRILHTELVDDIKSQKNVLLIVSVVSYRCYKSDSHSAMMYCYVP